MRAERLRRFLADKAQRYRWEKWWWQCNMPAAVILFQFMPSVWAKVSTLYLILVSIYALVLTAGGAVEAAKAAEEATKE